MTSGQDRGLCGGVRLRRIQLRGHTLDDKTALTFAIEPAFTLETEHADWKTGDWRPIKKWPLIHSESHKA